MLRRPRQVAGGSALGQRRALQSLASHEVRARFLRFFEARGHRVVPSASLVPPGGDGSLLFTNAGMVPFKQVFTGQERREYARATTAQRCVRAGGKHNDLDQVGLTRRHHTLFEMLGNFSFGDYFKEQAVAYSWEFLTRDLALPVDRLHVTVLDSDREARELWRKIAGLPDHKIVSYDEKENFWAMGDSGPCGPCSEIFWDLGDHIADPDERFLELWNLVFMQFQRNEGDPPDALHPLPNRSVDTGMGLERVASVLQNVPSNYHTDAFVPLMRTVAHVLDRKSAGSAFQAALEHELDPTAMRFGNNAHIQALRIIADHLRATYAMLRDGIFPSNIGRGYVLRRIIRRAIRHAQQLGVSDGLFLSEIVMPEWEQQQGFPQLRAIVANEERAFEEMLRNGRHAMEKVFASAQAGDRRMIAGFDAFRLYDTFGIPLDITQVLAEERGISVDAAGFDAALQEHRQKASESSAFHNNVSDVGDAAVREGLLAAGDLGKTEFVGYETLQVSDARVLSIRRGASPAGKKGKTNDEGKSFVVSIDPCPFYAEGGGQVGDRGALTFTTSSGETLRAAVVDTQKRGGDGGDMIELHCVIDSSVSSDAADHLEHEFSTHSVSAEVDGEFRSGCQAHHTATHMLQRALKQVLGDHVTQCGSFVGTDRLRFDFAHFGALSSAEIDQVEELVNRMALTRSPVDTTVLPRDQAEQSGAICNFGEKYGDMVRVVRVGVSGEEDLVSSEFCGGTHATNSLEVFPFVILSEGSVAAGTRRMEAVAGVHGAKHLQTKDQALEDLAVQLETTAAKVPERVAKIQKQVKGLESQLQALGDVVATAFPPTPIAVAEVVDAAVSVSVELHELPALKGAEMSKVLRRRAEFLLSLQPDRVILVRMGNQLVCASNGAGASHAGKLLQRVVKGAGGRGGGNATFAQGSLGADSVDGDELLGSLLS